MHNVGFRSLVLATTFAATFLFSAADADTENARCARSDRAPTEVSRCLEELNYGLSRLTPGLSCQAILGAGTDRGSGVYWIDPDGADGIEAFKVYCDMETDGGGWALVWRNIGGFHGLPATSNERLWEGKGVDLVRPPRPWDLAAKHELAWNHYIAQTNVEWVKIAAAYNQGKRLWRHTIRVDFGESISWESIMNLPALPAMESGARAGSPRQA